MLEKFVIVEVGETSGQEIPNTFIVSTYEGQPVNLFVNRQLDETPQDSNASIVIINPEEIESSENKKELLDFFSLTLTGIERAEGIILINKEFKIHGVIAKNSLNAMSTDSGFKAFPGRPSVQPPHVIYICPIDECDCPPVAPWQKGRTIPHCPKHKIPRVQKYLKSGVSQ
jgi:hypothetical protein